MNQEQLESLPCPMFKTTKAEKKCLRGVLPFISEDNYNYFLCHILNCQIGSVVAYGLKDKVARSVAEFYTLSDYCGLGDNNDGTLQAELRRIWIRKLLAYKPE